MVTVTTTAYKIHFEMFNFLKLNLFYVNADPHYEADGLPMGHRASLLTLNIFFKVSSFIDMSYCFDPPD